MVTELSILCAHCNHTNEDPLEVFDAGRLQCMRCDGCGKLFHFLIADCERPGCFNEEVFRWIEPPLANVVADLACSKCGGPYFPHEDPDEDPDA